MQVYTEEDQLYLVMDLATGGDLQRRWAANKALFKEEANAAAIIRKEST
jgi:hypothetical protein